MAAGDPLASIDPDFIQHLKRYEVVVGGVRHLAIVARENISAQRATPDWRWHISMSGPDDVPSWRALSMTAHALRPGVNFVSAVPSEAHWVNVHPHTLHLFQIDDPALESQWRAEGRGDRPS